jgi:hypothetical protein
MRSVRRAVVVGVALAATAATADSREPALGFVYVEANVDGASGGHAALRIGDRAYHYQLDGSLLLLERAEWEDFTFGYGTLENRPIHVASIELSPALARRVHDGLASDYLAQQGALDALDSARDDVAVLEARRGLRDAVSVRGAGLLDPTREGAPAALALRARVAQALGPRFLDDALAAVDPGTPDPPAAREALALHAALAALRGAWDVDPAALLPLRDREPLAAGERAALAVLGDALDRAVLDHLRSGRPDRGAPLLLATARRLVVARALADGRLYLLDPYPERPATIDAADVLRRRAEVSAAAGYAWSTYRLGRSLLLDPARIDEGAFARIEELAGRVEEYARGAESGRPVREVPGRLVPERRRALPLPPVSGKTAELDAALGRARARVETLRAAVDARYAYALTTMNCVTEILRSLERAFGGAAEMRAALGGELVPGDGLGFIPHVLFAQVRDRLAVASVTRLAPYRERSIAAMSAREGRARVYARESNTLSGTVYDPRDRDGSFLLFTDDVFWPRPLYGAANVAFALGDGALGLVTAPFDRGRRLVRAGRGAFFSAPELAFWNIRKGSFDAASLARLEPDLPAPPPATRP